MIVGNIKEYDGALLENHPFVTTSLDEHRVQAHNLKPTTCFLTQAHLVQSCCIPFMNSTHGDLLTRARSLSSMFNAFGGARGIPAEVVCPCFLTLAVSSGALAPSSRSIGFAFCDESEKANELNAGVSMHESVGRRQQVLCNFRCLPHHVP